MTMTATQIAAATPATRDRVLDLLRAASIAVVVAGHWLMAVVTVEAGVIRGENALDLIDGAWLLTWVLQVMPLFFFVGGYANLGSWRRGAGAGAFLAGRLHRLLAPTAVFVVVSTALWLVVARVAGGATDVAFASEMLAKPLWFLAVYLLVIAATPWMAAAHDRAPRTTLLALAAGAGVVDLLRLASGIDALGAPNFALVWLFAHQLGFWYRDGMLTRRAGAPMAIGGLAAVALLTNIGVYAPSLVGSAGELASNNSPPSIVLVAHAVWLTGVVLLAHARLARVLERPRVWLLVVRANTVVMTLFLWHLTALAIGVALALPLGFPQPGAGSAAWWLTRPLWLAVLALALAPLVRLFARFEHPAPAPPLPGARVAGATVLALAGLAALATWGFSVPGAAAVAGAAALTGVRRAGR